MKRFCAVGPAMILGTCIAQTAYAQEEAASGSVLEEIVVTATGHGQVAFDVPLAISVVSGEELTRSNISSLDDIQRLDPALNVRNYGAGISSFIVRGIVSQAQPTTAVYYGEAPLIGGHQTEQAGDPTPSLRLVDLDRLEVLKGPQGTLFGAGSMSGVIRAIPAEPELDTLAGSATAMTGATRGGNTLYSGNAVLNLPVSSNLALRTVGWFEEGGGYIDQRILDTNAYYKNANDSHVKGARVSALWEPAGALKIVGKYTRQEIRADGTSAATPEAEYRSTVATTVPYKDDLEIADVTAHLDALNGTFMAAFAYTDYFRFRPVDTTDVGRALLGYPGSLSFPQNVQLHAKTLEFRYTSSWDGPFGIVTGAFFQEDKTRISSIVMNADTFTGVTPCVTFHQCVAGGYVSSDPTGLLPGDVLIGTTRHHGTKQQAYYTQGEYKATDTLTATVGVRYFRAKLEDDSTNDHDISSYLARIIVPGTTRDLTPRTQSKVSYNFSLTWKPVYNLTTYVRAASGFRIGGLNDAEDAARNFGVTIPSSYAPDSLWNYELGSRVSLFERRLLLDGSVFHIDWSGQQLPGRDPTGAVLYTLNAGSTNVDGFELTLRSKPLDGLSFDAGITLVNAELAEDLPRAVVDGGNPGRKGDLIPNSPRWSASMQAEYSRAVGPAWEAYLGGSLTYKDKSYNRFESDPEKMAVPDNTIVGFRVGVRSDHYDIGVVADNIFDEYAIYGVDQAATGSGMPDQLFVGRPRTISLRVGGRF